ncbi:MAG: phosphoribosylformylglycinamidine synthase subunit PurS [Candidatus Bathyarchaeota archaeon]|nr:phosphoribosylformylglycinamidine synthase subunit PurS [Candidatus Bathyarchaeota archaeon]
MKALKSLGTQIYAMRYQLKIEVSLKPGHSDPEGETTARLLNELGYKVETVNVSKVYSIFLEAESRKEAEMKAEEMCKRLLANPTKDNYSFVIEEEK